MELDDRWPAGRPAAPRSAFFWTEWEPQCNWTDQQIAKKQRDSQTERVERARAAGDTTGTIASLSNRSAKMLDATRSYWNGPMKQPESTKQQRHGGAYSRAKG